MVSLNFFNNEMVCEVSAMQQSVRKNLIQFHGVILLLADKMIQFYIHLKNCSLGFIKNEDNSSCNPRPREKRKFKITILLAFSKK